MLIRQSNMANVIFIKHRIIQGYLCTKKFIFLAIALACIVFLVYQSKGTVDRSHKPGDVKTMNIKQLQTGTLQRRLPTVIVIGSGKSGTEAFMAFLGLHPSVAAKKGDIIFFNANYARGFDWYRRQMPLSSPGQITIEKTAAYMYQPWVAERIHKYNKYVKLIMIVRNPVPRLLSSKMFRANMVNNKTEIEALEEFILLPDTKEVNPNATSIRNGRFSDFIPMWHELFSKQQLHVVDGEVFIKDPYAELQKVEEFLGISSFFRREMFHWNEEKGFFCPMNESGAEKCIHDGKGRKHMEMPPELKDKLNRYFKPYNEKLNELTGRHFSWV